MKPQQGWLARPCLHLQVTGGSATQHHPLWRTEEALLPLPPKRH